MQKKLFLAYGLELLFEDRDIMAVNKPAGLLSIATGTERNKTAYWILSEYLRKKGEKHRAAVVHRLDRDTSGVMLFAKSEPVKRRLMKTWNEIVTERRDVALAEGIFAETDGVIDMPLMKDVNGRMAVNPAGVRAITRWRVLEAGKAHTLLALGLETGRQNQIRAHLAWAGHPVAGDRKYGGRTDPLHRLALHAERIAFYHPHTGRLMEFEAPVNWRAL
jgi:23S rRNA pseudouridine1911/1915/1917 synthase